MICQRNKPMLNDANKNDHECVFYIICLEQNFYIDVLLRNMHTHNILIEITTIYNKITFFQHNMFAEFISKYTGKCFDKHWVRVIVHVQYDKCTDGYLAYFAGKSSLYPITYLLSISMSQNYFTMLMYVLKKRNDLIITLKTFFKLMFMWSNQKKGKWWSLRHL